MSSEVSDDQLRNLITQSLEAKGILGKIKVLLSLSPLSLSFKTKDL